jgi:hypothetical protein
LSKLDKSLFSNEYFTLLQEEARNLLKTDLSNDFIIPKTIQESVDNPYGIDQTKLLSYEPDVQNRLFGLLVRIEKMHQRLINYVYPETDAHGRKTRNALGDFSFLKKLEAGELSLKSFTEEDSESKYVPIPMIVGLKKLNITDVNFGRQAPYKEYLSRSFLDPLSLITSHFELKDKQFEFFIETPKKLEPTEHYYHILLPEYNTYLNAYRRFINQFEGENEAYNFEKLDAIQKEFRTIRELIVPFDTSRTFLKEFTTKNEVCPNGNVQKKQTNVTKEDFQSLNSDNFAKYFLINLPYVFLPVSNSNITGHVSPSSAIDIYLGSSAERACLESPNSYDCVTPDQLDVIANIRE